MNDTAQALTCPKCGADMRTYERNGVVVDQCTGCRGIFLDRGELERLVDAEGSFYADSGPKEVARSEYREQDTGHGHGGSKKRKRRSFLENLFED